jgi:hypothetical protein
MRWAFLLLPIYFLFCFSAFAGDIKHMVLLESEKEQYHSSAQENPEQIDSQYNELIRLSQLGVIDNKNLSKATHLMEELLRVEQSTPINSITYYYGLVCLKASSQKGVKAYIKYLISQEGSAEEQLSFSFDKIFQKRPEVVLREITKHELSIRNLLLDHLVWGILNNRWDFINDKNSKDIFFKYYDKSGELYKQYPKEIDYILQEINGYFDWLNIEERKKIPEELNMQFGREILPVILPS